MISNYIKIALRNLLKHKLYSVINILGLAVGIAACLVIMIFIKDELSYDRHHPQADRIHRITRSWNNANGETSLHLARVAPTVAPLMRNDFPTVPVTQILQDFQTRLTYENNVFIENRLYFADEFAFTVFGFKTIKGNRQDALKNPNELWITESMAKKYFGVVDPVGKTIRYENEIDLQVVGVLADPPPQTHFHYDFLVSFSTFKTLVPPDALTDWGSNGYITYAMLPTDMTSVELEEKFISFVDRYIPPKNSAFPKPSMGTRLHVQKITDIHLYSHLDSEIEPNGNILYIWIFSLVAVFVLMIACINFMNLATAKASERATEVGVRKAIGAHRGDLIRQFLSESLVITAIAFLLAIGLVELSLPVFSAFIEKTLELTLVENYSMLIFVLAVAFLTGILAGSYPAIYLSSFEAAKVLKEKSRFGSARSRFRSALVVAQFAISIILIIGIGVIQSQLDYCRNTDMGFDKDRIVSLFIEQETRGKIPQVKTQLLQSPGIEAVAASSRIPSGRLLDSYKMSVESEGTMKEIDFRIAAVRVDEDFFPTYGIPMTSGRNFSKDFSTDDTAAVVFNESSVAAIGWKSSNDALGKTVIAGGRTMKVIGIVKDFHFESMHEKISPMVFFPNTGKYARLSIRLRGARIPETIEYIKTRWAEYHHGIPFEFQFVDENFDQLYRAEERLGSILRTFAALATFIACLGLVGLAAFMAERRTKEIGIRKVMGATTFNIVRLLSSDFAKLVLLANVIAWPAAYYVMKEWLATFVYHTDISILIFIVSGAVTLSIAILTVAFQAF
ncbi:MAG TPA: ABC transporter permease, partial [bacterium]|nr:ABC transporter permease [bacterium]